MITTTCRVITHQYYVRYVCRYANMYACNTFNNHMLKSTGW